MRSAPFARRKKTRGLSRTREKIRIWPGCDGGRKSRSTDRSVPLWLVPNMAARLARERLFLSAFPAGGKLTLVPLATAGAGPCVSTRRQ